MDDTPVCKKNQILCTLSKGPRSVNDIVNDTGVYKKFVLAILPSLEKGELVTRYMNKKLHKQKEFLKLTELGIEFANFLDNMDKFDKFHLQLRNKINENFNHSGEGKPSKSILRSRGWEKQEISSYDVDAKEARIFQNMSLSMCIDALKSRYAFIISRFSLTEIAQDLLLKTVASMIDKCILIELESIENDINHLFTCKSCNHELLVSKEIRNNQKSVLVLQESSMKMFDFIDQYSPPIYVSNRFISNEARNVITSLLLVSRPPRELMDVHIQKESEILKEAERAYPNNEYINRRKQLLSIYRELNESI